MANRCDGKSGLFSRCRLESLHPGLHSDGTKTWPRTGSDLDVYTQAIVIVERERRAREERQRIVKEYEARGETI